MGRISEKNKKKSDSALLMVFEHDNETPFLTEISTLVDFSKNVNV
jgi:hypothetical protein